MYNIIYDEEFYDNIIKFSNYLKDYYFNLYTDTGIIDENIILNSYEQSINTLQDQIFDNIDNFCKTGLLGRTLLNIKNDLEKGYFYIKINSYKIK